MFSLKERKKHTQNIINYIEKKISILPINRYIIGYFIVLFHWIITLIPLIYIFIGKINNIYIYCCFIWIVIFIFHFYFKGCIITRIERNIWNEKKWWGPWIVLFMPLEKIGIEINNETANNIFIYWGFSIILIVLLRLLIFYKTNV